MANGGGFFVLDLQKRTASPLNTTIAETVTIAPDGQRMWTFQDTNLASVDFKTLSPTPLVTDLPISAAFDVARDGGRSLVAMHTTGTVGATVFDALNPDTATSRRIPAILLEAP
jgi:hypothetical protein